MMVENIVEVRYRLVASDGFVLIESAVFEDIKARARQAKNPDGLSMQTLMIMQRAVGWFPLDPKLLES